MATIFVNGKRINVDGDNISICNLNGSLSIRTNGREVSAENITGIVQPVRIEVVGTVASVESDGSVDCGDVRGDVSAGGSANTGDVGGNVKAGGSVNAGNVAGKLTAGGSVNVASVK